MWYYDFKEVGVVRENHMARRTVDFEGNVIPYNERKYNMMK